jgi:predicted amidohydrolase
LKISLLQMPVSNSVMANAPLIRDAIEATEPGAYLVTPECALSGYLTAPSNRDPNLQLGAQLADELEGIEELRDEQGCGLVLGTSWAEIDDLYRNQARWYDPKKGYIGHYAKQSLCMGPYGGGEERDYLPGHELDVFPTEDMPAGVLICNDAWHHPSVSFKPHRYYAQELRDRGCQILFVIANCNTEHWDDLAWEWHDIHLRMTARENGLWVAVVNPCTTMWGTPCAKVQVPTGVIDPQGNWVAKAALSGPDRLDLEI